MADPDGHSGDSRTAPGPGSSASNSYSSWYESSRWSASGSRTTEGSLAGVSAAGGARGELARQIPRRPRVSWWLGLVLALGFAVVVTPAITAGRWLPALGVGPVTAGEPAQVTVRVPPFAGVQAPGGEIAGGGVI
ncbi:MAG TPA: hypothetical protein VK932_15740, partial [Kofleriaceae bacterium]|nr:hypothetical protein [Kofleriaceae bacterium]